MRLSTYENKLLERHEEPREGGREESLDDSDLGDSHA